MGRQVFRKPVRYDRQKKLTLGRWVYMQRVYLAGLEAKNILQHKHSGQLWIADGPDAMLCMAAYDYFIIMDLDGPSRQMIGKGLGFSQWW